MGLRVEEYTDAAELCHATPTGEHAMTWALCLFSQHLRWIGFWISLSRHTQEAIRSILGGGGFVPDITALQAWLECAWKDGFDPPGAEQLGNSVQVSPLLHVEVFL